MMICGALSGAKCDNAGYGMSLTIFLKLKKLGILATHPKIDLVVDGKTIEIKKPSRRNFELNKALLNPGAFQDFARNPRAFAARYDLNIDADISLALSTRLQGITTLKEARSLVTPTAVSPAATLCQ
jgi:hypothetical protein